ncbi:related to protein SNF7 [Cephalotrichum gorgonifer]|uniref:Related to protein SNF7 n=1 Tax=Cephalotrichum gorgonifer TaxID=2041049 RepID=A0AAE8N0M5_9PEZI|nr:related to protein SNF7 [Cephalotrichum gorgonifer]
MGDIAEFLVQNDTNFRRARLPALYSDFRSQKLLNPDGFQANVAAWREALSRAAWDGRVSSAGSTSDLLTVPVDERLVRGLEYKQFGRPLALGAVVNQAVSEKDFLPLDEFLLASESIYAQSWASLPKSILSWAAQRVWAGDGTKGEDKLPHGRYVVVKNLETATKALAEHTSNTASVLERAFTKQHFYKTFSGSLVKGKLLSERDMEVLLKYASRDKGLIAYDGKTIKLQSQGSKSGLHTITEEDAAISSLKELIEDLKAQTSLMERRIEELTIKAKEHVARNNRVSALALLKSRKLTEACLEKRHATLSQLEQVADKIEQASDHVQLVKVMEASTGVLQSLNKQVGGVERVEQAVDSLREQMGEVDEVGDVLASAGSESIAVDEAEIDDELAELEASERLKAGELEKAAEAAKEAREVEDLEARLDGIPKVAQTIPGQAATNEAANAAPGTPTSSLTHEIRKLSLDEPTLES